MKPLFAALAASVALASAVAPATAHAEDFDGPYAGVQGGLSIFKAEGSTLTGPIDITDKEAFAGGLLGYRASLGQTGLVLGAEGDLGIGFDSGDLRYGASGILGVKLGGSSLLYTRAGYGWRDGMPADTGSGLVLGAGFETKISSGLNLRLDYKHLDLGDTDLPDNAIDYSGHEIAAGVVFNF